MGNVGSAERAEEIAKGYLEQELGGRPRNYPHYKCVLKPDLERWIVEGVLPEHNTESEVWRIQIDEETGNVVGFEIFDSN